MLYQKYRPQDLDEIIGNENEIESLKKILEREERPHVFLVTGPSGCGKTTISRIMARKLGADELSILEINSANNRGIDSAREIIQQLQYKPIGSNAKVFIVDELHQTSKDFQNAMLKPLEDTPNYVYFFLCTTDPQKLIEPLKTRCTQIRVVALDPEIIYRYIRRIALAEKIDVSKDVLKNISENSNGSPRTAVVLLEKIADVKDEKTIRDIISIGEEAERDVIELCRALINTNNGWENTAEILKRLKEQDPEKVRYAVMGYMNAVLLKGNNQRAGLALECFSEPFWNSGKSGLTLACYQVIFS